MNYTFKATKTYWRKFYALSEPQKQSTRAAWSIFRVDPFDPRLRTHKIHRLSAAAGHTVYSVVIEGDLRSLFYIKENVVYSFDIGTHRVYR